MTLAHAPDGATQLILWSLSDDVLLLEWEAQADAAPTRYRPFIAGRAAAAPFAHVAQPLSHDRHRHLLALRGGESARSGSAAPLEVRTLDGRLVIKGAAAAVPGDPTFVLSGLADAGRSKVARFFFETTPQLFKLYDHRQYAAFCRQLFRELFERPARLAVHCRLGEQRVFAECRLPSRLGERIRGVVITPQSVRPLPKSALTLTPVDATAPARSLSLLLTKEAATAGAEIVLISDRGLAGRVMPALNPPLPDAAAWLRAGKGKAKHMAPAIIDAAAHLANDDPVAAALARELALIHAGDAAAGLAGGVDNVLAGEAGILVTGWYEDRAGLFDGIVCERLSESREFPPEAIGRFRLADAAAGDASPGNAARQGFALFLPWPESRGNEKRTTLALLTLSLKAKSGSRLPLWQGQPTGEDGASLRRVLAALPAHAAARGEAEGSIVPLERWLRGELDRRAKAVRAHDLIALDAAVTSPEVSVVTPLAEDPRLLRASVAALATTCRQRRAEIVFVAKRPFLETVRLEDLLALTRAYGLAARLAVVDRATGTGSLFNAGAMAAAAPVLVLLGTGVVPEACDWLDGLMAALTCAGEASVVAARALAADESIRAAGFTLDKAADGRLDLIAGFAGFPRDYPGVAAVRSVDAVSSAALAITRKLFEGVGGFDDRYLTASFRDADFCLEVRRQGGRTLALPDPVVFDLSDLSHDLPAACLPLATELDRRLFEARWRDEALKRTTPAATGEVLRPLPRLEVAA
jgi:hypothetical protein